MKKAKNIHNLDALEKEICRLQLEAKSISEKLGQNFEHFHENYYSMTMNSFCHKNKQDEQSKRNFFESFFKNETVNTVVAKVTDHVANRAAEGVEDLINKLLNKKKNQF